MCFIYLKKNAKQLQMSNVFNSKRSFRSMGYRHQKRDLASRLRPTPNGKRQAGACRKSKKIILF